MAGVTRVVGMTGMTVAGRQRHEWREWRRSAKDWRKSRDCYRLIEEYNLTPRITSPSPSASGVRLGTMWAWLATSPYATPSSVTSELPVGVFALSATR